MVNSEKMGKLTYKLILIVKIGTETNIESRIGTMTWQNVYFGNFFVFSEFIVFIHKLLCRKFHLVFL